MIRRIALVSLLAGVSALVPSFAHADSALMHPDSLKAKAPASYRVAFKTTAGNFTVAVTRAWAPIGADRFYNLVKHGYFNGESFFRVVPGFVVQFGLSGNATLNTVWPTASIQDDPVKQTNAAGTLSFADSGPNSRTTQLFINLGDNARLDGMGFAPFGKIVSGMDAVKKIYSGYGETPDQAQITASGDTYLKANFPHLDRIISARIQ